MRGRALPLSYPRRLVCDLMYFSMAVPRVTVQRRMNIAPLVAARHALPQRPSWTAIFTKGYALLADECVELRRAYLRYPVPHLYEYPESAAGIAHERDIDGERAVLQTVIKSPARKSIRRLSAAILDARTKPVEEIGAFRKSLRLARLPLLLRRLLMGLAINSGRRRANDFGTFHLSVYSGLGAESFNPLSPVTTLLNYGPIDSDGGINVRILYDHRVMDGATVARALARFETILNGPVVDELMTRVAASARGTADSGHAIAANG